jgi:hypothetical protein
MLRSKKLTAALVATVALGVGAGLGMAQAGGQDPPPAWHPTPTDVAVPATEEQKAAFSVLASTQRTETESRAQVVTLAERSGIGMDPDGARVVGSTAAGPIWLIPANGGLCLGLDDTAGTAVGATCEASDDVIARGTTIGDGTAIYGITPDGVTDVTVTSASGTTTVPVASGGTYTLPSEPATISVDGPGGLTQFDVAG